MTEWQTVYGSQLEKPSEFDTTSSAVVVYQRRNVNQVEVDNGNGIIYKLWEYEERKMSRDEYSFIMSERNAKLEDDLTNLQLAMCDLYESLGG